MKKFLRLGFAMAGFLLITHFADAQKTKKASLKNKVSLSVVKAYANPQSISDVKDILINNEAYNALKELIEKYQVTMVYDDNSFRGNANLKRGDFVVSYASALQSIRSATKRDSLDTVLVNTYDRNRAYITSVTQVKDLKPGSIYYVAVQNLLEDWGINAPFTKAAVLNAQSLFYQDELYDILRVTLGYQYSGITPRKVAVTRNHFAIILDDALNQKMKQIDSLAAKNKARADAEKARVKALIEQIEQNRHDSISKEIEARKIEAQKKEEEARKKLGVKKNQ